ncbi:MAG: TMEM165/GDT1 family protein [Kiritimatiellae bacterium]|nr:TMEM165/GDT1 family protein [Kiritimatiellia bacterium]
MASILLKTFALVFMAELGDKTQLATLAMASGRPDGKVAVFLGAALALATTSLIAVVVGDAFSRIPNAERVCRIASGVLFLVFGVLTLAEAFRH